MDATLRLLERKAEVGTREDRQVALVALNRAGFGDEVATCRGCGDPLTVSVAEVRASLATDTCQGCLSEAEFEYEVDTRRSEAEPD